MNTKILREIGFTEGEVKVYMALVGFGESTIGPLAKKSGVTAAKVYPILEKLKAKGLIIHFIKSGTKHFRILNPNRILDFMGEKEKELRQQKQQLKKFIPQIKKKKIPDEQYTVIYETLNGLKTLYDDILDYQTKNGEDFRAFSLGPEYRNEELNRFFKSYDAKRKALGINLRLIGIKPQKKFLLDNYGRQPHIKFRFVDMSLPSGVVLYGDNVVHLNWGEEPTAFVIHSKTHAKAYNDFFEELWRMGEK
ncbi:TrmB family transcriptional regulator [Nanoarchaeota archaeon]